MTSWVELGNNLGEVASEFLRLLERLAVALERIADEAERTDEDES